VEGSCEYGNEGLDSIKCREILDWLSDWWLLKMASILWSYLSSHPQPHKITTLYSDVLIKIRTRTILICELICESCMLKNAVFWDMPPYRSCTNRRFVGTYRLHLQGRNIRERGASMSRWL
jgi:hypothetical protein